MKFNRGKKEKEGGGGGVIWKEEDGRFHFL